MTRDSEEFRAALGRAAGEVCRMDLQWKDEPSQVAATLVQGRGWNRSSVPLAMLLSGVSA